MLTELLGLPTIEATVLRQIVETDLSIINADEGSLLVMEADFSGLRFACTVGSAESEKALQGQFVPMGEGVTGLAAATRQVQIGAPVYHDVKQTERLSEGPESVIAAPVFLGDSVIGVLTAVSFQKGRRFTAKDAELHARFARLVGFLVEQTRMLRGYQDPTAEPKDFNEAGRLERETFQRLRRIISKSPDFLKPVVRILEGIEEIAGSHPR